MDGPQLAAGSDGAAGGIKTNIEVHFINEAERPPRKVMEAVVLVKILCMTWAGHEIYKEYTKNTETIPLTLAETLAYKYIQGKVSKLCMQLKTQQRNLKDKLKERNREVAEAEGVARNFCSKAEPCMKEWRHLMDIQDAAACDKSMGVEASTRLFTAMEKWEKIPNVPMFYGHTTSRGAVRDEVKALQQSNFLDMMALTREFEDARRGKGGTVHEIRQKAHEDIECAKREIQETYKEICDALSLGGMKNRLRIQERGGGGGAQASVEFELYSYDVV